METQLQNTTELSEAKEKIADLERWKQDALIVLGQWESVFETLPAEVRQDPANLGRFKSEVVKLYITSTQEVEKAMMLRVHQMCPRDEFRHIIERALKQINV